MNLLNKITIRARLILAFTMTILLFAGFGVLSVFEMERLGGLTSTLYEHPLRVSNAALRASMGVIKMHRSMKDVSMSESDMELQEAIQAVRLEEDIVYKHLDIIKQQILGEEGETLEKETRELFANWKPIRDEVIAHVMDGDKNTAARITREKGADYVSVLERKMLELTSYARNKADGFMNNARKVQHRIFRITMVIIPGVALFSALIAFLIIRSILSSVSALRATMSEITKTGTLTKSELTGNNEITEMARHFNVLIQKLQNQFWLRDGKNSLNQELSGKLSYNDLATKSICFVSRYADACAGVLYTYNSDEALCELRASYAFVERKYLSNQFNAGEGIVGQAAVEKKPILLRNITREEAVGNTGTVSEPPKNIYAVPMLYEEELYGILEIASFEEIKGTKIEFLDSSAQIISTALYTAFQNQQIKELLESARKSNEALQIRGEELNEANEKLKAVNDELQAQSDELQAQSNELKAQADELKVQKDELEVQQSQVEEADRLKSEFLSNMSHELRTPLNSVLALSQLMIARGTGKDPDQEAEYLRVIERNGRSLLSLINDILDLSKIEAGRMDLYLSDFDPRDVVDRSLDTIHPLADEKGLRIISDIGEGLSMHSDEDKVHQILLNLFSNAVKFTEQGEIRIRMWESHGEVSLAVRDTGIGISKEDIVHIFDEFRQADGSTTRQHQGTGLGLAICQKLAGLIGGEISAESEVGLGSTFTLNLPLMIDDRGQRTAVNRQPSTGNRKPETGNRQPPTANRQPPTVNRQLTTDNRQTVLIIEDDEEICNLIKDYLTDAGYQTATARNGKEGLKLASELKPFAITLDILMPEMDGWEVIRRLKALEETADIPVIIVSVSEDRETGTALGASGYVLKPIDRHVLLSEIEKVSVFHKVQRILVVDDDPIVRDYLEDLLGDKGYVVETAADGKEGIAQAVAYPPDIMILDLMMPGTDGFTVLDRIRREPSTRNVPVIILTAKTLTREETVRLADAVHHIITKGKVDKDQLLHKIEETLAKLTAPKPTTPKAREKPLILIVEDNEVAILQIRSILEEKDYDVHSAFGGSEALASVEQEIPDAVILDLMMPEVDGFQVLEQIRSTSRTADLPVLVLTAKELTAADKARLSHNNIQQLIQKGAVDRDQLVACVTKLLESRKRPDHDGKAPAEPTAPEPRQEVCAEERPTGSDDPGETVILIVEDNPDNLFTMSTILDGFGYSYITAGDGEAAVRATAESHPDLILMDVQLPVLSGLDATRQIKSDPSLAQIPIIAVTARAMRGDRKKILAAGCDDYLSKPIDPSDLIELIRKYQ
ncbi:response regulator [Desulfobacterales bacterium HSG2]|nr:response regulator [Desulfobacterales bacterium HSG2]